MLDCIFWTGFKSRDGYGIVHRKNKLLKAHRIAYCAHHSIELRDIIGVIIRHKCDNRSCVNPHHLEPGTSADNTNDRHVRGRDAKGESNGMAKLTEEDVRSIRAQYKPWSRTNGAIPLAAKFGVSKSLISQICNGVIWKSIEP